MNGVITPQVWQIAVAYVFVVILLIIVRKRGISREKEILIGTVRMTLQLILAGYILMFLFDNLHPALTVGTVFLMETFAIYNTIKRIKTKLSASIKKIITVSMISGTLLSLVFFIVVVLGVAPWYNPRYFIPIAGMLIGNSMTGISLGVNRLVDGMHSQRHVIEAALMLGATPKTAAKKYVNAAFDAAILPTINSMIGMGIVFLPGMMTGQILSGTSPMTAIEYQIVIMLGILGSVTLTVIMFVQLASKSFFNAQQQLVMDEEADIKA
jgi:putative ABC transport system permease protein